MSYFLRKLRKSFIFDFILSQSSLRKEDVGGPEIEKFDAAEKIDAARNEEVKEERTSEDELREAMEKGTKEANKYFYSIFK